MTDLHADAAPTSESDARAIAEALMATTTDALLVRGASGRLLGCSASGLGLLGLDSDDVVGRAIELPLLELLREDGSKVPPELYPSALALTSGRDVEGWTHEVQLRSGERRWLTGDCRVVRDDAGTLLATVSRFTDVTEEVTTRAAADDDAARFRTAFERSPVALLVVDDRGRFLDANAALADLFGIPSSEIRSMDWIGLAERKLSEQLSARLLPPFSEESEPQVLEYYRPDGSLRHGLTQMCSIRWPGTDRAALVQITDVTQQVMSETTARVLAEQIDQVFTTSPIGMGLIGPNGTWTRVNRSLARLHGVSAADMTGRSPLEHVHPGDRALINRFASRALDGRPAAVDHRVTTASGEVRWYRTQLTKISTPQSPALLVQTVDQTAERRSDAEMRAHDRVTGMLSQKGILAELEHTMLVSGQAGEGFAVICVDIDGFRAINDRLGVRAADRLLEHVGVTVQASMPVDGAVGRVHGDVFVGVAPITSRHETKRAVESVQRGLQAVIPRGEDEPIGCRLGAIFVEGCDVDPYDLLSSVEQAAQAAVQVPERFVLQTRTTTGETTGSASDNWCHEIESALHHDRLMVVGEPIHPVGGGDQLRRYEMLVRLVLPGGVKVSMPRFERHAQRLGKAAHIDHFVLRKACGLLRTEPSTEVEVNLSLTSINDPETIRVVGSEIERSGIDPTRLLLALDEELVADALADVLDFAHEARSIGVGFCVDNYRLSHQGLRLIETVGARRVKLPSSVMRQVGAEIADSVLLRSTIRAARDLGVEVAVPFVTDAEAFERARELGVDYAQGRFVGSAIEID